MTGLLALSIGLGRPIWLLVLLLAPLFAWYALRGSGGLFGSGGRRRAGDVAAVAARSVLLLLVALALALPTIRRDAAFRAVAYVLDVSESVPEDASAIGREFVRRSAELRGEDDDAALIVFADGAAVEAPFTRISYSERLEPIPIDPEHIASVVPRGESDIAGALQISRASFPPGGARRIVLVTDGNETRGSAVETVRDLVDGGADVQVVPLRFERERDVLVQKLVVPATVEERQPAPVRAVIESTHAGVDAQVRFIVDGEEVYSSNETLREGRNVYEMGYPFEGQGYHRVEVRVDPVLDGDPRNNVGMAATRVRSTGRVLVVTTADSSHLASALNDDLDVPVDAAGVAALPVAAGGYVDYDCVVLENVPAFAMSATQRRVLAAAVRDLGVGLVCIGGNDSYGPGGYAGTPLEEVLPVSCDIRQKRVLPSGALVVILHTCEFPGGNTAARQITVAAMQALSSNDEFGVLLYTGVVEWLIPLERLGDKRRHMSTIKNAAPADMPSFDDTMIKAEKALAECTAATKHMIIISDGDPTPPNKKLAARIKAQRITMSTVCVDPHMPESSAVMKRLSSEAGGRHYDISSKNLSRLPQIFIKEAVTVRRSAWRNEAFTPALSGTHVMLRGFKDSGFPQLGGYTVTSLKPRAEQLMTAQHDDPLLATWRHGLGEVTAWTSDAGSGRMKWAGPWLGWGGYSRFFGQMVRATARALERSTAHVVVDVEGGRAHVVLDALTPDGSFENGLRVTGLAVRPDGETVEFEVAQSGPGRYEGRFPASDVGTYVASLLIRSPDGDADEKPRQALAAASVAYSAEHRAQRSNERLFAMLETAGATIVDLDADVPADGGEIADPALAPWSGPLLSSEEPVPLWPWIAALAALVMVIDVAVRRLRLKLPQRIKKTAEAAKSLPAKAARLSERMARPGGAYVPPTETSAAQAAAPSEKKPDATTESGTAPASGLLSAKKKAKKKQSWEENQ